LVRNPTGSADRAASRLLAAATRVAGQQHYYFTELDPFLGSTPVGVGGTRKREWVLQPMLLEPKWPQHHVCIDTSVYKHLDTYVYMYVYIHKCIYIVRAIRTKAQGCLFAFLHMYI
jgi:hypothetical protein